MPRISVVIPCHNGERFLDEALRSILDQSYQDYEVIVVDDGSTDRSAQIVKELQDPRVRYLYQENQGPGAARNAGSALAEGEYLAYLDADDMALPHRLAAQVSVLEADPTLSVVGSGYVWVDEHGREIPWSNHSWQRFPELNDLREWLFDCPFVPSATMLRRSAWEDVGGFDEDLIGPEDWNFWMRLVLTGHRMAWHRDVVCLYRWVGSSLSHNAQRMARLCPEALRRVIERPDFPPHLSDLGRQALAIRHVDGAKRLYTARLWDEGRAALGRALTLHPHLLDGLPSRIEDELVSACLDPLVTDSISVMESIFDHLPDSARLLAPHRRRMLVRLHLELLVRGLRQRDHKLIRQHWLPVVLSQPRWLLDPGMRAVLARAIRNRRRSAPSGVGPPDRKGGISLGGELHPSAAKLTQVAGAAMADMGIIEPSDHLLEPVARTIHGLTRREDTPGRA